MSEELKASIEHLYSVFSRYSAGSRMEGCPCCVSDGDKEKIHTKSLRLLNGDDLSRYAFKAISTWGDTDDFKHYLPRIFELLSTTDFVVDTFVVLGKLEYGLWTTWEDEEQNAIRSFLLAWWKDMTMNKSYFDQEAFLEIYKLIGDIDQMLNRWVISFDDNSFRNLIDLIDQHYYLLINKNNHFKGMDNVAMGKLLSWLKDKKDVIEKGFFYYDQIDKAYTEKVSNTLYTLERTT